MAPTTPTWISTRISESSGAALRVGFMFSREIYGGSVITPQSRKCKRCNNAARCIGDASTLAAMSSPNVLRRMSDKGRAWLKDTVGMKSGQIKSLEEPFLWLPSLEGPTPDYTQGVKWLTEGWSNGAPALGWHDTLCYLVLPVLLVASQYISTSILTPKPTDESQQQNQAILKFLPLMIGWFSLSVPSGLGLYWLVNNVVTTATTVLIRGGIPTLEVASAGGPATAVDPPKPQGFGRKFGEAIDVSSAEGATVTITPPGAGKRAERRAAAKAAGAAEEVPAVEATTMVADAPAAEAEVTPADVRLSAEAMGASPATSAAPKKTRKKKKTVKRKK